jgi:signal transduction histidine kinase
VLLSRLRIRGRLALLAIVPLLATVPLTGFTALELAREAARANSTAETVRHAQAVLGLERALQKERLLAVGLMTRQSSAGELMLAQAATDEAAATVIGLGLPDVEHVVANVSLQALRAGVAAGQTVPGQLITAYSGLTVAMIDSLHLLDAVDGDTAQGREVLALDGVMRTNEGFATIMAALAGAGTPGIEAALVDGLINLQPAAKRFLEYASAEESQLYGLGAQAVDARLGGSFRTSMAASPGSVVAALATPPPFRNVASLTGTSWFVEAKIISDALEAAHDSARSNTTRAIVWLAGALVNIIIVGLLGAAISRSVSVPVRQLTRSANHVANLAEAELIRVADDDSLEAPPPRLEPIAVAGRDELADFARAFGRVQETAARLVERQMASRRNVALMFRHVGRRTQNLVGRQISLIDRLEAEETDPDRLGELYRLDHISSRLRRNASSLVVLSGATTSDERVAPFPVDDVIRLGLAEIENYTRVDIDVRTPRRIAPALINDLVLLVAELMENATLYSPPGTRVLVSAESTLGGLRIRVIDHGLGMTAEQIEEENARLTRRERLDLAPTEVLGLFVVGRLARRHGLGVGLAETPGGGVTATVDIPTPLLSEQPGAVTVPLAAPAGATNGAEPDAWSLAADPHALDRAARTMRELRPWNAFDTGLRTEAPPAAAAATLPVVGEPLAPLHRRVPGATLDSLQGAGPTHLAPMATSSADEARDSLAAFESGVARAMRDLSEGSTP